MRPYFPALEHSNTTTRHPLGREARRGFAPPKSPFWCGAASPHRTRKGTYTEVAGPRTHAHYVKGYRPYNPCRDSWGPTAPKPPAGGVGSCVWVAGPRTPAEMKSHCSIKKRLVRPVAIKSVRRCRSSMPGMCPGCLCLICLRYFWWEQSIHASGTPGWHLQPQCRCTSVPFCNHQPGAVSGGESRRFSTSFCCRRYPFS